MSRRSSPLQPANPSADRSSQPAYALRISARRAELRNRFKASGSPPFGLTSRLRCFVGFRFKPTELGMLLISRPGTRCQEKPWMKLISRKSL